MLRKRIIYILILLCCIIFTYLYVFEKPHRDYIDEEASFDLIATDLFLDFQNNESRSNKMYLNKMIQIEGYITSIQQVNSNTNILIDDKVFCILSNNLIDSNIDSSFVKLKGRCTGYDDVFMQVTLDNCVIIE